LFSSAYHNKLLFLWCAVIENSSNLWVYQVRCFCAWKRTQRRRLKRPVSLKN